MLLNIENSFIPQAEIDALLDQNAENLKGCFSCSRFMSGWFDLPSEEIDSMAETALAVQKNFDAFVVCGIGGSALGAKAVHTALNGVYYNENKRRKTPKLYIEDNIDPARVKELLEVVDLQRTVFNFISKSGETMETLAQLSYIEKKLHEQKLEISRHIIVTAGNYDSTLYAFAKKHGCKTFRIPENTGGRFSVFTPAGLLPLMAAGIEGGGLLKGASAMKKIDALPRNPAALFAAVQYLAARRNRNIVVLMPYAASLMYVSDWFCQLWGESLGKNGKGQTPVAALGTTDQHSLLQLLMDGPQDKTVVFIETEKYGAEIENFGKLQTAALSGVRQALTEAGRPNLTITLPEISEHSLGELLMFFMMATAYGGALYNINPYDQPGVEAGKKITKNIIENLKRNVII